MLEHESEYLYNAATVIRKTGVRPFTEPELEQIEDAVGRIRRSIRRVLDGPTHTIFDWGFCLYLSDSGYNDEEFSRIDKTGKAWKRHVRQVTRKSRAYLPRLAGLRRNMRADKRVALAEALEEAATALSNAHMLGDDD